MDAATANAVNNAVETATARGLPIMIEVGEKLPEIAPILVRNAEGTVQAGKTAVKLLKAGAVAFGTGLLFGSGAVLFVAGAGSVFWAAAKAKDAVETKLEERRERKAKEEYEAKKTAAMGVSAVPSPV